MFRIPHVIPVQQSKKLQPLLQRNDALFAAELSNSQHPQGYQTTNLLDFEFRSIGETTYFCQVNTIFSIKKGDISSTKFSGCKDDVIGKI